MAYDVLATTVRNGLTIDEIEFVVDDQQPSTGYVVRQRDGLTRRGVLALHDERSDKAALLPELTALGNLGFVAMSIDCAPARDAIRRRDLLGASVALQNAGQRALDLLSEEPEVNEQQLAVVGHGLGGEIAAALAVMAPGVRAIVAVGPLLHRGAFVRASTHPLTAGMALHLGEHATSAQANGLDAFDLSHQMHETSDRQWLVQLADDDDRLSDDDRHEFTLGIPPTIRVCDYQTRSALHAPDALGERVNFVDEMTH